MTDFLPFSIKNCDGAFNHNTENINSFFSLPTRDNKVRVSVVSLSNYIEVPSCIKWLLFLCLVSSVWVAVGCIKIYQL